MPNHRPIARTSLSNRQAGCYRLRLQDVRETGRNACMTRPRRSHLFMPGSNPRALEKARNLAADGLILDLEDSVAPDAKAAARDGIAAAIAAKGFGKREILIRTNGLDTPWWA